MRYMSSNKKLVILSVLVFLCVFSFYKIVNYYRDKDIEVVTNEVETKDNIKLADETNDEINLGDMQVSCATYDYSLCKSVCDACDKGLPGSCSGCSACKSYQTKCLTCSGKNTYLSGDGKCYRNDTCKITINSSRRVEKKAISLGNRYTLSIGVSLACGGAQVVINNASIVRGSTSLSGGSLKDITLSPNNCGGSTGITVTSTDPSINPPVTVSFSISDVQGTWKVYGETYECHDDEPSTSTQADQLGLNAYYTYSSETRCRSISHMRNCGSHFGGGSSVKYSCYGDASKISLATKVSWQKARSTAYPTLISSVTKKEDCVVNQLDNYCEPTNIAVTPQEKAANICEDNVTITSKDGLDCNGKKFYSIICNNETSTSFDNGDDKSLTTTTNKLLVGQGFKYGITVTTKRQCTAIFNATNWKEAYKLVTDKINLINNDIKKASSSEKTQLEKQLALYQQRKKDLTDIVAKYNSYDPTKAYSEIGALSINYSVKSQAKSLDANFQTVVVQKGSGAYSDKKVVDLGTSGVTNPYNYTWKNNSNPRIIKLIPEKAYINEETGEVSATGLDGGNKVYIDYNTDPGTYKLNITVSGVGGNNKVNNDKCEIKVEKEDIIYRPIDVSNPFINNNWTPGSNWVNNEFDFRNIIHSDVWTKDGCYSKYSNGVWTKCNQE